MFGLGGLRALADAARDGQLYYSHHVGDDPAALAYCQGVEHVLRYVAGDAGPTEELQRLLDRFGEDVPDA